MKRWHAALVALILLFSGVAVLAEDSSGPTTADIQESMVTREGEAAGTLLENISLLMDVMQSEEFSTLMELEDGRTVVYDIVARVGSWLIDNPEITGKILAELGAGEKEQWYAIQILSSARRVTYALNDYASSEEARQLFADYTAMMEDPDIKEALNNFKDLLTSESLSDAVGKMLTNLQAQQAANASGLSGILTQEAQARNLNTSSFTGRIVMEIFRIAEQSDWARSSLPKLQVNENLWRFCNDLANCSLKINQIIEKEYRQLASDPELILFVQNTIREFLKKEGIV